MFGRPSVSVTDNPYLDTLQALVRRQIPFILVGVGAINFYAKTPASIVATQALDILVPDDPPSLRDALAELAASGFELSVAGEPFLDVADDVVLAAVLRAGAASHAQSASGAELDVTARIAGYSFQELASDAVGFRVGDVEVRVGRLGKLLRSKELADRPKDRAFLQLYRAGLEDESNDG